MLLDRTIVGLKPAYINTCDPISDVTFLMSTVAGVKLEKRLQRVRSSCHSGSACDLTDLTMNSAAALMAFTQY
jgi:hypothetical protein